MPQSERKGKRDRANGPWHTLTSVLQKPLSLLILVATVSFFIVLASFADDLDFLARIFRGEFPLRLLVVSFGGFLVDFFLTASAVSLLLLLFVALLAGIQISLMVHLFRFRRVIAVGGLFYSGLGTGALLFGLGCVVCGSFFAPAFLATSGFVFAATVFPFVENGFYVLGILFFLSGIVWTLRTLNKPAVC